MKLAKQVRGAMVYPVLVLLVSAAVTMVLLVWVIPIFQKMFQDFGSALPAPTQMVVDMSEFTRHNIVWIVLTLPVMQNSQRSQSTTAGSVFSQAMTSTAGLRQAGARSG